MSERSASEKWSAVAALSSAIAAICALVITLQERNTPYKTALYAARWEAIQEYARASADVSTELNLAAIAVPESANTPETLSNMSDEELRAAARAARPMIKAWGEYISATSAVSVPWSTDINQMVSLAEGAGRSAYECYRRLGAYVDGENIPPGWWNYLREIAAKPCENFRSKTRDELFNQRTEQDLRVMTNELREDNDQFVPGAAHNLVD